LPPSRRQQLLAALIDNHIYQGNQLGFDVRRISWRRVSISTIGAAPDRRRLGGTPTACAPDGFDTWWPRGHAILCLAGSLADLKERLGRIVAGYRADNSPVLARELKAHGAMAALLKTALAPIWCRRSKTPGLIHGGPFANMRTAATR